MYVLRYIEQSQQWKKAEYRQLSTRNPVWNTDFILQNGFVEENKLYLQEEVWMLLKNNNLHDTLILEEGKKAFTLQSHSKSMSFAHFIQIKFKKETSDIWLEMDDNFYPLFGSPARGDFEIMPLMLQKPISIAINAKYWHTLTGFSVETYYIEKYLYFAYLGKFDEVFLTDSIAQLTLNVSKNLDFRKILF